MDPSAQGLNAGVSVRDDDHDFECSGGDAKGCGRPVRVAPLPLASMGALSGRLMFMMSPSLPRDGGDWRNPPHVVELADSAERERWGKEFVFLGQCGYLPGELLLLS